MNFIVLFFFIQFICFLYDVFSAKPLSKNISLFFVIINTIIYIPVFLSGLLIAVFSTDSGETGWVLPILLFSYLIFPYIVLKSFSVFIKKHKGTFKETPIFTVTEKILFPLVILVLIISISLNPISPKKIDEKISKEHNDASELGSYVESGYLFYSDPSLLAKGEKGLNSVINDKELKFKNGVAKNKYFLTFSEDKKSFTVLVKSFMSKKEGIKMSVDDRNNIHYNKITETFKLYVLPNTMFEHISFQVSGKENNVCSKKDGVIPSSPLKDFTFEETNDGFSIKEYIGKETSVYIPCYINGKPVVEISEYAFNNKGIKSIYISSTIKIIKEMAFANNEIDSVDLYDNLTYIGKEAFMNNKIRTVLIPSSVKEVGDSAFHNNEIEYVFFNNGVEKIADHAFQFNNIQDIVLPHSLKEVGEESFAYNQIKSIYMFENVSSISDKTLFNKDIKAKVKNNNPYYSSKNSFLEGK